jgi:hypothetical protein
MSEKKGQIARNEYTKGGEPLSRKRKDNLSQHRGKGFDQSLSMQRNLGNMVMQRMVESKVIQAKLKIGQPNDKYEQEADRVADQVIRIPEQQFQRACSGNSGSPNCPRTISNPASPVPADTLDHIHPVKGVGKPLEKSERDFFESRFGHRFDNVRLFTGTQAEESAQALNARAFTVGSNIVFGAGQNNPVHSERRKLLAHELTHVIQQGASRQVAATPAVKVARQHTRTQLVQRKPAVSSGEFGKALEWYTDTWLDREPEAKKKLVSMLKSSATFMAMVASLDSKVISWRGDWWDEHALEYALDENGWLRHDTPSDKSSIGKRLLFIQISHRGTFFNPYGQPVPGTWDYGDTIYLQFPKAWKATDEQLGKLAGSIAHETKHVVEFISSSKGPAADAPTAIARGIKEEALVRKTEHKVLKEIRGAGKLSAASPAVTKWEKIRAFEAGTAPADVERSFPSMKPTKTYLELFLLGFLKEQWRGDLSAEKLNDLTSKMDEISITPEIYNASYTLKDYGEALAMMVVFGGPNDPLRNINMEYAALYLVERVIGMRWDEFLDSGISPDDYFDRKEDMLQEHLRILNAGTGVAYSPRIPHPL